MSKGLGGFGRYDDDPDHIGCPYAKTDMTPCAARDGRLAEQEGSCVGCGVCIADAFQELVKEASAVGRTTEGDT